MILELSSHSPDKTLEIGRKIGSCLQGNEIILLCGELGAGKTLLTKGIAASLGIDPADIVSPTFTLLNQYEFFKKKSPKMQESMVSWFIHFDCYRLADLSGGTDLDSSNYQPGRQKCHDRSSGIILPEIDEWIDKAIVVIEWAQYLHHSYFNLKNAISVRFTTLSDQDRLISIESGLPHIQL